MPSYGHLINVKLTRDNHLLWKAQILPILCGHQLLDLVKGTDVAPSKMVIVTTEEGATQAPNPEYNIWLQKDQMVLSTLLASLSPECSPESCS